LLVCSCYWQLELCCEVAVAAQSFPTQHAISGRRLDIMGNDQRFEGSKSIQIKLCALVQEQSFHYFHEELLAMGTEP
jgi:hypothetical protein